MEGEIKKHLRKVLSVSTGLHVDGSLFVLFVWIDHIGKFHNKIKKTQLHPYEYRLCNQICQSNSPNREKWLKFMENLCQLLQVKQIQTLVKLFNQTLAVPQVSMQFTQFELLFRWRPRRLLDVTKEA